jgi:hypothetical protein
MPSASIRCYSLEKTSPGATTSTTPITSIRYETPWKIVYFLRTLCTHGGDRGGRGGGLRTGHSAGCYVDSSSPLTKLTSGSSDDGPR